MKSEKNMEKEIEQILPAKTVKEIKRKPLVYIGFAVILAVFGVVMTLSFAHANSGLKEQRDLVANLNTQLQKSANELQALQDNLSKTEEGRQQLEAAKAQVETENQALDARATSAEQTASKAKSDLARTQAELSSKQAELSKISADLSSKQEELAKAQRGIAKFDTTKSLFNQFAVSSNNITSYFVNAYEALEKEDYNTVNYYVDLLNKEIPNNTNLYNQIQAVFTQISSGNY